MVLSKKYFQKAQGAALYSKILILHFPPDVAQKAVVCYLTKKYDLLFNILGAKVSNSKDGYMVLEIFGTRDNYKKGLNSLKTRASESALQNRKSGGTPQNAPTAVPAQPFAPARPSM